jgi:hypothetical protein
MFETADEASLASTGTYCVEPAAVLSGFAIRKPPNDWERLRSWSILRRSHSGWRTAGCVMGTGVQHKLNTV